jgi:hypothetical protein
LQKALFASLVFLAVFPVKAFAWGSEAHRVIAEIAELFLEPQTAHQVHDLLAVENATTLADVSMWADEIRPQHPETAPWHYVDIPVHPPAHTRKGYDPRRDCPEDQCVVAKIDHFEDVLTNKEASARERLEALKYLVHFIGDVHQPLHAATNDDKGGNKVVVRFMGHPEKLHAVWDSGIIHPAVRGDERGYALGLVREVTAPHRARWSRGDPISWANESHRIAVRTIYGLLPHTGSLPDSYEAQALPIVNEQLERAGLRLAATLNAALR